MSSPSTDSISQFFATYPEFDYDPTQPPGMEWERLREFLGIPSRDEAPKCKARSKLWTKYNNAIAWKFNTVFGTDINSLASWQALCTRIQIDPVPDTVVECRRLVLATHVNLVDLVDGNEITIRKFLSVDSLRQYSVANNKIFPRRNAYAGGLLRYLLREFFSLYLGRREDKESQREGEGARVKGRGRGKGRGGGGGRGRGQRTRST